MISFFINSSAFFIQIQAAMSRSVVEEYKRSFVDIHFTLEKMFFLVYICLGVVVFILLHKIYKFLYFKVFARTKTAFVITRKSQIKNMLVLAQDERRKFELRFLPSKPGRKITSCFLLEFNDELASFELGTGVNPSQRWIDRNVEFFFRAPKGISRQQNLSHIMPNESRRRVKSKKGPLFFSFKDSIRSVKRFPNGQSVIQVGFPQRLVMQQKRRALRIVPPDEYVLGCALWPDQPALTGASHTNARKWGKPALSLIPSKPKNLFTISDISAAGIHLAISTQAARNAGLHLALGDMLVLLFDLFDPDFEIKRRYWVQARVQNTFEDLALKIIDIGLQFQRVARSDNEADPYELTWSIIGEDGLETLGNWVMKRHLEIHRKLENPSILPKEAPGDKGKLGLLQTR